MQYEDIPENVRKHHPELVDFVEWLDRKGYLHPETPMETLTKYWDGECCCES